MLPIVRFCYSRRTPRAAQKTYLCSKPANSVGSWSFILARPALADDVAYRVARALHQQEAALAARLSQARETTAANAVAAAPRRELIHPDVLRYLHEIGLT